MPHVPQPSHIRLCEARGLAVTLLSCGTVISMPDICNPPTRSTASEIISRRFYHGTRADLKPGDLIHSGYSSNYAARKSRWVYFSETLEAATWGAELATGDGAGRIYVVQPTGAFIDDPN